MRLCSGAKWEFPLTLLYPGDETSNMELNLITAFEEAKVGLVVFTLYEGRQWKAHGKLENFVTINMGEKYQKKSANAKDCKCNPWFKEEQIVMWANNTNWVDDVMVRCYDDDGANNQFVGQASFSLIPYMTMSPTRFTPQSFAIKKPKEPDSPEMEQTGEIVLKVQQLAFSAVGAA